jgi:NAD-dependent deacetylase
LLRPDVVWFNECLPVGTWRQAERAIERCDLLLVVGTSGTVYPAAGLIGAVSARRRPVIECNLNESSASDLADVRLIGPSGEILPLLVRHLERSSHDGTPSGW